MLRKRKSACLQQCVRGPVTGQQHTSPSVLLMHVEDAQVLGLRQHALDIIFPLLHACEEQLRHVISSTGGRSDRSCHDDRA